VQAFPQDIERDVLILLQDRTVELYRCCGGELVGVLGLEEWMVFKTLTNDLEVASKRLGRACADEGWKTQSSDPTLISDSGSNSFLQKLKEESDVPTELLLRLWADNRVKIKSVATSSFDERLAELRSENKSQLELLWKSRVYLPARLYQEALETLETSPLKEQLSDLLSIHLTQDLLPNTLKRIRNKGLIRDHSQHQKQLDKLQSAVSGEKKTLPVLKSLDKFHEKMGFVPLSPEELTHTRKQQVTGMVHAMPTDTDSPRLFLATVLVLLACKHESGIVYATGKFAPRLLKVLKPDLDEEHYKNLERLKEAVKAGNVKEEDRSEMREIAARALDGFHGISMGRTKAGSVEKDQISLA
jgi:hypothetical protein